MHKQDEIITAAISHDDLRVGSRQVKSFSDREKLFQIDQKDYSELEAPDLQVGQSSTLLRHEPSACAKMREPQVVQEEYKPYFDLWSMAIEYNGCLPKPLAILHIFCLSCLH